MAKRENGSGTVAKRKFAHGTKYIAYTPAKYTVIDGKYKMIRDKIGSFSSRKEAREALELYNKHPTLKYNFTLEDTYNDWKKAAFLDISAQTQTSWTTSWTKIKECTAPALTSKLMREITTSELRELLEFYAKDRIGTDKNGKPVQIPALSKSYVTKIKALLTQLWNHATENNIVDRNYAALVKLPKMEAGTRRAMTDLEFAKLEKGWETATGGDACYVLCYTGFRVTEFCQLTKFSYDSKAKTLTGGIKTEAGRDRIIPIHPKIQPIIERWHKASTGPLFPRPDGKAYTKDSFLNGVWKPCMRSLGLPDDLTPHSARHTFGTRMAAAGARPEDIQKILGHTDYSMTANTYINQDISTLKSAVDLLA